MACVNERNDFGERKNISVLYLSVKVHFALPFVVSEFLGKLRIITYANQAMTNLSALNEKQQREAVVSEDKRLLVLAGAGSGKTKTLLQKIIYLIEEKGVSPLDILAITFTKNAANEMLDRLILSAHKNGDTRLFCTTKRNRKRKKKQPGMFMRRNTNGFRD
jgi:diphthamide biosynthesis methyltransferase